jgi:pimeloyl-ACP methyl ester carboxylesterase
MPGWHLDERHETAAGTVAAGRIGEGPDLVLAHGWPWSSFTWHRVIPALAERFRVHWYDMPGYGRSAKSADQRTSLDVQGEIFAEMMGRWGLERPSVVAHDFGGAATLRAHLLHGCDFTRYVLMNAVAIKPWGSAFFEHMGRHIDAFQGLPAHIHRALVAAYIEGALVNGIALEDFEALVAPWLTEDGAPSFYRQFAQADEAYTDEVAPHYGALRCPALVLWGEADPWIPLDRGRTLHGLLPGADFAGLQGIGHLPQLEAPDRVIDALRRFL